MNLQQSLITWIAPALLGAMFLCLVLWDTSKPMYLLESVRRIAMGLIMGYFINLYPADDGNKKFMPIIIGVAAFLAQWIGELILKNKWIILKAKTGLNGSDEKNKE